MRWFTGVSIWEVPFVVLALFVGVGLIRPALPLLRFGEQGSREDIPEGYEASHWYGAFRNTLVTLIGMFTAYLCFEFATLFKREFATGFYYAGYAHQGAAWLTFALALATGLLSLMFRSSMLRDKRLGKLKQLAWAWSGLNGLLGIAVYNRLMIYVGYNGMTRMRMVGFFGITLVIIGFALVVYKIAKQRSFWWLIRSQLIAFAGTILVYSVFPVDYVSHRYNAFRVNDGYLRPAVMIAVKPINNEGFLPLLSLTEHPDKTIREGVQALLARKQARLEQNERLQTGSTHWTNFQASRSTLHGRLQANQSAWKPFEDPGKRNAAIEQFRRYAMQWY